MKSIVLGLAAFILLLMVGTTAADPGIVMEIAPIGSEVLPGETATYEVNVSYFIAYPATEHVALSIDNAIWSYTYDPAEFDIRTGESKYSTLSIDVPQNAQPGTYVHKVNATGTYEIIPGWPMTQDVFTDVETTVIPEFTTIAVPAAAIFGLVLLIRRRKQKK